MSSTLRYRGHRAHSFITSDVDELIEIRARQRTFDGAYRRTALANLGYALTVLKLFDKRFYRIGVLYTFLACFLFVIAFVRQRHSCHDFADDPLEGHKNSQIASRRVVHSVGQGGRIFGRPFVTAGWIVVFVTVVVAIVEIALLALLSAL